MIGRETSGPRARISSERGSAGGAIGALAGSLAAAALMCAVIALTPATYEASAEILIGPEAVRKTPEQLAFIQSEAQLIGSRDLARQAIRDLGIDGRAEFSSPADRTWFGDALVSFGFLRDPARISRDDRVLRAYEERIKVSVARETGALRIAVRSEDPVFAAVAANRIADLYLQLRARADLGGEGAVLAVAATAPPTAQAQGPFLLLLGVAAFASSALAGLSRYLAPGGSSHKPAAEAAFEQPLPLGQSPAEAFASNSALRGFGPGGFAAPFTGGPPRGLRIGAASLGGEAGARPPLLALARQLAEAGHAIVIDFDGGRSLGLPRPVEQIDALGRDRAAGAPGLAELLSGSASFAEVIRRDPASRLHFVAAGPGERLDWRGFDGVLEALETTYDFILMIAPPLDQSSLAKSLAAKGDVFVLATSPRPRERAVENARAELTRSGARDVVVAAAPSRPPVFAEARAAGRDAA